MLSGSVAMQELAQERVTMGLWLKGYSAGGGQVSEPAPPLPSALPGALTPRAGDTCFSLNPNPQLRSYKCEHLISVTANVLQQKTRVNKITNYPVLPPLILKAKHSFKPGLYILTVKVSI